MPSNLPDNITVNVNNNNVVNIPRASRGAGTVLVILFFWWLLPWWWMTLATLWVMWLPVAAVVNCFDHDHEYLGRTWYLPWPAWMFGIR